MRPLLALVSLMMLVGCGDSDPPEVTGLSDTSAVSDGPVTPEAAANVQPESTVARFTSPQMAVETLRKAYAISRDDGGSDSWLEDGVPEKVIARVDQCVSDLITAAFY